MSDRDDYKAASGGREPSFENDMIAFDQDGKPQLKPTPVLPRLIFVLIVVAVIGAFLMAIGWLR